MFAQKTGRLLIFTFLPLILFHNEGAICSNDMTTWYDNSTCGTRPLEEQRYFLFGQVSILETQKCILNLSVLLFCL